MIAQSLAPMQARYRDIMANGEELERIYKEGAEKAYSIGRKTLSKVYRKVGFLQ